MPMRGRYRLPRAGPELDRRHFLAALSVATLGVVGLSRCSFSGPRVAGAAAEAPAPPTLESGADLLPPRPRSVRIPLPGGVLSSLPGDGDLLALTVDDRVSSEVVRGYTQFAKDTGARLTYFVNGGTTRGPITRICCDRRSTTARYNSRITHGSKSHKAPVNQDSGHRVRSPVNRCGRGTRHNHHFLWKTYGVDTRPYFRPPYGAHNEHVAKVAGDLGYTVNTLWSGDLKDHVVIPETEIVKMAEAYLNPQAIVIGHLNHMPVTPVYGQLVDIIRARGLRTVTLEDVFLKP